MDEHLRMSDVEQEDEDQLADVCGNLVSEKR